MTMTRAAATATLRDLGEQLSGAVVLPGEASWDTSRAAWNLAVDQRPIAVVHPETASDVVATVRLAAELDLAIAFNGGGHNTGTIDWTVPTILLKTDRMRGIEIDAAGARARVEAGVLAKDLVSAAGEHGLAFLSGTAPDVGVVGYALGGGLSWIARAHGLACNSITAADVVTADGRLVHADADTEPELFWAIRGGGGNFGAVTNLEFALVPLTEIHAGAMFWPIERAVEILTAWRGWVEDVPDSCESLGRMLQLPDVPFLPEHLRSRSFVLVEAACLGTEADAVALLQPLRDLGPEFDTFVTMPPSQLSVVNMDPDAPTPVTGDGMLLGDLPIVGIQRLVDAFVGSSLLHVEVRQLGGALAVGSPEHGVLDTFDEGFVLFALGLAMDRPGGELAAEDVRAVVSALAPWDSGRRYLNFTETAVDPRSIFPTASFDRLLAAKATYDPANRFHGNHPLDRVM